MGEERRAALARVLPYAAVVGATLAFQLGAAIAKSLFPLLGPEGTAALRLALGTSLLLALVRPWRGFPRHARLGPLLGLGVATAAAILFFYLALGRLPQGVAIALQFLGPLSVGVAASRRLTDLIWAGLAALGVWTLLAPGLGGAQLDPLGIVWALCAAAGWAAYILFGRAAGAAFGWRTPALALSVAALIVVPVGAAHAGRALLDPALLPIGVAVALISTVIPFSLELYALPRIPARTFAVLTSLEPAFGAAAGFVMLHERLAASQLIGVVAVITAAAGSAWSSRGQAADIAPN